jgi:hypothetical protein
MRRQSVSGACEDTSRSRWRERRPEGIVRLKEGWMGVVEILGLAASVSLLAGWRLYLAIVATGLAMRMGILPLPGHLAALDVLANPWVLGVAALAAAAEFLADKVAWFDSVWDAVHTLIRPLGGALLALAIVDPGDPAFQAIAFVLGGGAALAAHGGKAGGPRSGQHQPRAVQQRCRLDSGGRRLGGAAVGGLRVSLCRSGGRGSATRAHRLVAAARPPRGQTPVRRAAGRHLRPGFRLATKKGRIAPPLRRFI